ncbi:hypothetical protein GWI33_005904 [Rhynchophorus ferrugineus]|uniref:Uncharacterized protein n=1 Tax=Rhynchophorus ferrugineus TaxID=354439 RepID=A0A834IW15_RHYFE|nr:hypothetical protein GWI33_005904 [Rhynchophorus ferrugineus]
MQTMAVIIVISIKYDESKKPEKVTFGVHHENGTLRREPSGKDTPRIVARRAKFNFKASRFNLKLLVFERSATAKCKISHGNFK